MENIVLQRFNGDISTKEGVQRYIQDFIDKEALVRIYSKQSVADVADARALIDKAFIQLGIDYGIKITQKTNTNEAR